MSRLDPKATLLAIALALAGTHAAAQSGTTAPAKPTAQGGTAAKALAGPDQKFVEQAAMGGMAEIEMSKMAQQKASNAQVKQFAQRMVDDHGKANAKLMSMAQSKGVMVPTALDPMHKSQADKLSKLSGAEFDREYMQTMVANHGKSVALFKDASKSASDPQLKAFATQTLPTLEEHNTLAKTVHGAVQNGGKAS